LSPLQACALLRPRTFHVSDARLRCVRVAAYGAHPLPRFFACPSFLPLLPPHPFRVQPEILAHHRAASDARQRVLADAFAHAALTTYAAPAGPTAPPPLPHALRRAVAEAARAEGLLGGATAAGDQAAATPAFVASGCFQLVEALAPALADDIVCGEGKGARPRAVGTTRDVGRVVSLSPRQCLPSQYLAHCLCYCRLRTPPPTPSLPHSSIPHSPLEGDCGVLGSVPLCT